MIRQFNTDNPVDFVELVGKTYVDPSTGKRELGVLPRKTKYGQSPFLVPLGDYPKKLVDKADYKEVVNYCNKYRMFAVHHQRESWGPKGFRWNQNGLNYCWAFSLIASMQDVYAKDRRVTVFLAPTSLGWLVNWRNAGYYLEDAIEGATKRGVCELSYVPDILSISYRQFKTGWEDNALLHRLSEGDVWDLDNTSKDAMIQHCVTVLHFSDPVYIAYNWWGHALELVGLRWDETQVNNLVWIIRNSHNEDDVIEMVGSRAVPDEAYGPRSVIRVA